MFKIYKNIFNKIIGKDSQKQRRTKTKKSKPMATRQRRKLLSPEQKAKIMAGIKRGAGAIIQTQTKKTIKTKKTVPPPPKKAPAANFWTDTVDLGIIKPTGQQLVIGAGVTILGGALAYKAFK